MSDQEIWIVIISLGVGTFLIRYSFLGIIGGRELPKWLLTHLRYVPVAVLPGLVAPLVVWPAATAGSPDAPRIIASIIALLVGAFSKSTLGAIFAGMAALYLTQTALL